MIQINSKIFRAYDIRGIYPSEINEDVGFLVGRSLAIFLQDKYQQEKLTIVVGRDGRESSLELSEQVKKGALSLGVNVIDVGLVPSVAFYFSVWNYGYDGGVFITASHNPSEYNGFKLVERKAILIAANTGMDKIKSLALNDSGDEKLPLEKGKQIKKNVLSAYQEFVLKSFDLESFKPLKIAIDCANGASSVLVPSIVEKIPGDHKLLFCEIDGKFSNHLPDPSQKANLEQLSEVVKGGSYDLGVAFDGDGDRVGFVDEKGEMVSPNLITAFLTKMFIKEKNEKKIIYTVCMSRVIADVANELGGETEMTKVGFTFVKEKTMEANAALGAEISGHYCLKSDNFCEGPIFVWLAILNEMSKTGKKASEIFSEFKRYFYEGPLNYEVENKERVLKDLENYFKNGKVSYLDGIRVDFDDWWFNARPSNTENLLRVVIEAKNKDTLEQKKKEILKIVGRD